MKSIKLISIVGAAVITLSACNGMTRGEQRIATNAAGGAAGAALGAELLGGTGGAAVGGALGSAGAELYQQNQGR